MEPRTHESRIIFHFLEWEKGERPQVHQDISQLSMMCEVHNGVLYAASVYIHWRSIHERTILLFASHLFLFEYP